MKFYHFFLISFFVFILGFPVLAQEAITFPVEELGGCQSFRECADFCDQSENFKVCTNFAEGHGMVAPEKAAQSRKMIEIAEIGGPGGCKGQDECETYCNVPEHMEECIIFAMENDLIPSSELEEAKKVLAAIRKGAKPPPCGGKRECDEYCSQPEHLEECIEFGEAAGFIGPEEVAMVRKTGGKGPGGCKGKEECDVYCNDSANMEECINFGIQYGLMPPNEIEEAKKMLQAIKKGVKPPDCRSKEECDIYCSQPEHAEECMKFAVAAGFISPEQAEQAEKMMKVGLTHGPGGCKGKEECEAFCDNPDNIVECTEFALKAGFISPEEAAQSRKMAEMGMTGGPGGCRSPEECDAFCSDPAHQEECFEFGVKAGFMSAEEADKARKMRELEERAGPGGCRSKEECEAYCNKPENMEECMKFGKEKGLILPTEEMMPEMVPGEMMPMKPPEGMMPPEGEMPFEEKVIMPSPQEIHSFPKEIKTPEEIIIGPPSEGPLAPFEKLIPLEPAPMEPILKEAPSEQKTEVLPEAPPPPKETPPSAEEAPPQTLRAMFRFLANAAFPFLKGK